MKKYIFYLFTWCWMTGTLSAQTLNQAKKLFENGKFEQAKTAFSKLIKRSPNSENTTIIMVHLYTRQVN